MGGAHDGEVGGANHEVHMGQRIVQAVGLYLLPGHGLAAFNALGICLAEGQMAGSVFVKQGVVKQDACLVDGAVIRHERALAEITAQLDAVRTGDFTDGELQAAIRSVASDLRATADAPDALAWYWLNRTVQGLDIDPAEMAALVEEVSHTDVTDIAAGVVCDCVYLLKGTEGPADDE